MGKAAWIERGIRRTTSMSGVPHPMTTETLRYAGFWPRLCSSLLDIVICLPIGALEFWGTSKYRLFDAYFFAPGILFGIFYNVYLVHHYGGTPGKLLVGIQIRKVNGKAVGYREALLRYSVDCILSVLMFTALVIPTLKMSDSEYLSLSFTARSDQLVALAPAWYSALKWVQNAWVFGELAVLLTNRKRRALHDFIGGTVVVHSLYNSAPEAKPPEVAALT
ncbi:MAG TPA: RDD family protein [Steroidobacteraceae bacterium]